MCSSDLHFRAGPRYGLAGHLKRTQEQALARARHVWEKSMFDGIVLGTIRRIVGDADFQAETCSETLEVVLEYVAVGGVTATAIAQEQHSSGVGIGRLALEFPPTAETIAGETTGIVAEAQVQVAAIALNVVKTVRVDHARRGAGEIVVQRQPGLLRIQPALAKQQPQEFFVFGVHAHNGIIGLLVRGEIPGDGLELSILVGMATERQSLACLASSQAITSQQLGYDGDTDAKAAPPEFFGDLGSRQVGPEDTVFVRIPCGVRIDDIEEGLVNSGEKGQTGPTATPFFRARSG